jgi:RHS repeat-associated protein
MGNITSKNGLTLTYDDWGRMRTSNNGNGTYTYGVNGLDERVSKTNGTSAYYYIYAGVGQLLGIYNASGQAVDEMVYLNDKPIASMRSGVVYNVETDNLNTPVRVLDQSNNIDWSWEGKEPFGLSQPTSSIVNGSAFIFNLRFPGQYADQETGLFQNGYREYDPITGRYMEIDPLGLNAGWNDYNYVESNSLNNADPMGLDDSVCMFNSALCGNGSFNPKTPPKMFSEPIGQPIVDFTAGMGDSLSFNRTKVFREFENTDNQVCQNSNAYAIGQYAGIVNGLLTGFRETGMAINGTIRIIKGVDTLYHFTSFEKYAQILKTGAINVGENNAYGEGVYTTVFDNETWAKSVETKFIINSTNNTIVTTPFPGTFRIIGSVPVH